MTEVDISNKHLGTSGAIMASAFLPKMTALRSLNILGNNIGKEQANSLILVLDASDTLKTLCGFTGTEAELDLSNRSLSASCAILVANEVKFNSRMTHLDISGNKLTAK